MEHVEYLKSLVIIAETIAAISLTMLMVELIRGEK